MVVRVIDLDHVGTLEPKSHAPVPAHRDRPLPSSASFERMQIQAGESCISRRFGRIHHSEYELKALRVLGPDSCGTTHGEESSEALVGEAPYHLSCITCNVSRDKNTSCSVCVTEPMPNARLQWSSEIGYLRAGGAAGPSADGLYSTLTLTSPMTEWARGRRRRSRRRPAGCC